MVFYFRSVPALKNRLPSANIIFKYLNLFKMHPMTRIRLNDLDFITINRDLQIGDTITADEIRSLDMEILGDTKAEYLEKYTGVWEAVEVVNGRYIQMRQIS